MRVVALEEAFWCEELATKGLPLDRLPVKPATAKDWRRRLVDFTELRLPEMDRLGVDMQVLSLTSPGIQMQPDAKVAVADARKANDVLVDVIRKHPHRFSGFAALPLQDPPAAVAELLRAVELGMSGALVNDHTLGHYLDEPRFYPFWEALEDLELPLYIHPSAAPPEEWSVLRGHRELESATFSWAARTGAHAMRLIYGGIFDRYPRARIILGHMGEFLPFQLSRFDACYDKFELEHPLAKLPSEYFRTNIAITTTGVYSHAVLIAAIQAVGIDNVMFSIDYPYEPTEKAVQFMRSAPLAPADKERVAHGNADRILRLGRT